ncbi:MAG: tRNA lysidine(34) synthetase TilS [Myxococcota bacterium]
MAGAQSTRVNGRCQPEARGSVGGSEGYRLGMLDKVFQRALAQLDLRPGRLLVAVSGGRDSVVLLDLLSVTAAAFELELVVAHVHHGLRGEEADADAAHVAELGLSRGLATLQRRVDVVAARASHSSRTRPTLEEAARDLRKEALLEMAEAADCFAIATGHHAGDQAETVLMRLLRGTGPDGLAGISPQSRDGRWIRPLLGVLPEALSEWASARQLAWREDSTNEEPRFTRNQLRHTLLPSLAATFNPQILRTLSNLAEAQRRDSEWIESAVEAAAKERLEISATGIRFALDGWEALPQALARRLVRRALVEAGLGRDVSRTHLERVLGVLVQGRAVGRDRKWELPGGYSLRRHDEHFELARAPRQNEIDSNEDATVEGRD